jgi:ADP-L-glycero-D-manno-heptose 6-epimerase
MIVVTGAAGFIGANLVAALNARGAKDIVVADVFKAAGAAPPATTRYLDQLQVAERVDKDNLPRRLDAHARSLNAVFHLGACADTTAADRAFVMENNFEYSCALWQWCARRGVPFIYASSAATYGDGAAGYDDESDPRPLKPLNLYAESKQRFDLWALEQRSAPPRWVGLKYFNLYGPREEHKGRMASVAFHAFRQIAQSGQVRLFQSHRAGIADGAQQRDFTYVADAVEATLHFLDTPASPSAPNGLYNVGTGQARTFAELANAVFAALGRPPDILYVPMPEDIRSRYQYFTQATTAKLRRAGFTRPFRSLEQGVREYVAYLTKGERRKTKGERRKEKG